MKWVFQVIFRYTRFQKKKKKKCALFNVEYFENFFCKFGMVSPKYTIHRSNIKPVPCWAEIFALYGNT